MRSQRSTALVVVDFLCTSYAGNVALTLFVSTLFLSRVAVASLVVSIAVVATLVVSTLLVLTAFFVHGIAFVEVGVRVDGPRGGGAARCFVNCH